MKGFNYSSMNSSVVLNKLLEFNSQMGNNQEDSKLLKQSILFMKTGKPQFSLKNTFEFISLLTKWKEEKIFPLIDVFF